MFGGQNLVPFGQQIQYSDMWILSIPSFTWIEVDTSSQSTPYPRAGHSCNIWDGQMVVVGGYIGQDLTCESPGIYVFNTSSLEWSQAFTAISGGNDKNKFSQQLSQRGTAKNAGLQGSYGYTVPKKVYDVIGGTHTGGATITAPVAMPTSGPLATGKPITYTVTNANGGVVTETATTSAGNAHHGPNVGATVAGVIAGVLFIAAAYLAFCAFLYRKQLQLHKHHTAALSEHANGRFAGHDPFGVFSRKESTEGGSSRQTAYVPGHGQSESGGTTGYSEPSHAGSDEDLLQRLEPNYWGVLLHPRRSLRVINR